MPDQCPVCHQRFGPRESRVLITDCSCGPRLCDHPYHYVHLRCYDGSRGGVGL